MSPEVRIQLKRFREFLAQEGLKLTRQRRAIAEAFYSSGAHLSLGELLDRARLDEPSIGFATVYRTMKLLADGGLAVEHQFGDGHARYEPRLEGEHHDHLICLDCGWIVEFEDATVEKRQEAVAAAHGFRVASHRHEIYGRCTKVHCEHRS